MAATPAARAARWPLGFAALVLAYWAFDYSMASNMRRANPEAAYRTRPTDPGAVAGAMTDRMVARNQFNASADDASNARAGLRQDPLNRVLLRTLGVHEEVNGNTPAAFEAMQMAHRVSRRDSITELWLAEYHRRQDNPAKALVHYDAAMLVRPKLQYPMLAELVKLIPDRDFRAAVQPYVRRQASWTVSFIGTAAEGSLDDVVALVEPVLPALANGRNNPAIARITYRLAARGDQRLALSIAERGLPGWKSTQFSQFDWNSSTTDARLGALAWSFLQSERVNSTLENNEALVLTVSPLATEKAMVRDVLVKPNSVYTLNYRVSYGTPNARAQVNWIGECIDPASGIPAVVDSSLARQSGDTVMYSFRTGPGCHLLRLTASVVGADSANPSEIAVSALRWQEGKAVSSPT